VIDLSDRTEPLAGGISFPEGPRWHDGRLWFSDIYAEWVRSVGLDGVVEDVVTVPGKPSGLGFTPDGSLLVVSVEQRRLLRLDAGDLHEVADLTAFTGGPCNDMVVDGHGRAYVGNYGFDFFAGEKLAPATLAMVAPDGAVRVVADGLTFPNGCAVTPDGRTLIVAVSFAHRLTAFDIDGDGHLSGRRVWADVGRAVPDGIALDVEGGVWFGSPYAGEFLHVVEGGTVTHRVATPGRWAVACALGGPDRRTLFLCQAETTPEDVAAGQSRGWISTIGVDVPGAGWP
jgi:sugar lactone lactonase YvrE